MYHGSRRANITSLREKGIIPGGLQRTGGRSEAFFSPSDPRGKANCRYPIYRFESEIVVEVDTAIAEQENHCKFYYTTGGAVLCQETIPPSAFLTIFSDWSNEILWTKTKAADLERGDTPRESSHKSAESNLSRK